MNLSLEALSALDAIDREGSFAAASERLNKVPSALTYTMRKLEEDLDVLVFDRRGRKAQLTPAGKDLLEQGRLLLKAASDLECRVKRIATGWETELSIAVDGILPMASLWPLLTQFYAEGHITRMSFCHEVLGGSWEAMRMRRADIVVGAPGEHNPIDSIKSHLLGEIDMLLCMSPQHPLAQAVEPLSPEIISPHRIVAVADSSRNLPPQTVGILDGQAVLRVPDLATKISAMEHGLGIGHLPRHLIQLSVQQGRLVTKQVQKVARAAPMYLLHAKRLEGNAAQWWVNALSDPVWWQSNVQGVVIERYLPARDSAM